MTSSQQVSRQGFCRLQDDYRHGEECQRRIRPQRSDPKSRTLEKLLFSNPFSYRPREVRKHSVHDEIHRGKNENRCFPDPGHDFSAESKRRPPMCSNSMRALWGIRSRLWRNLGRSEAYKCAEENPMQLLWAVVKEAAQNWSGHRDARQGAALAYYSVFSLGPLTVIVIAIAGFFFGHDAVTGHVASSITSLLGDTGAKAVQAMLAEASRPREGLLATILGLGLLVFAAIGVVVQLKDALNIVWEVEETSATGVWSFLRSYVVSLAAVLA